MIYEKYFAVFFCVSSTLIISCCCLGVADGIKDASNAVAEEFNLIKVGTSDTLKQASNVVADEFKLIDAKTSDVAHQASNAVVDEFHLIEEKSSDALKYAADTLKQASNAVADEFKLIDAKASDVVHQASSAVVDEFHLIEEKSSDTLKYAVDTVVDVVKEIELRSYGCQCAQYTCGCCAHLEFPKIHLNDTGCVNITYLAKDYGISFTVTIDNLTIYNETISAHNPPPICFGAPFLEKYAELCVHFYDLDASKTKLHGCVDIEARLHKIVVGRYKVGCFDIGKSTLGLWKKYHLQLIEKIRSEQKKLTDNLFT